MREVGFVRRGGGGGRERGREDGEDVPVLVHCAPGTHAGGVNGDGFEGPTVVVGQCLGTHDQDAA